MVIRYKKYKDIYIMYKVIQVFLLSIRSMLEKKDSLQL